MGTPRLTKLSRQVLASESPARISRVSRQVVMAIRPSVWLTAIRRQVIAAESPARVSAIRRQVLLARGGPANFTGAATQGIATVW